MNNCPRCDIGEIIIHPKNKFDGNCNSCPLSLYISSFKETYYLYFLEDFLQKGDELDWRPAEKECIYYFNGIGMSQSIQKLPWLPYTITKERLKLLLAML